MRTGDGGMDHWVEEDREHFCPGTLLIIDWETLHGVCSTVEENAILMIDSMVLS